MKKLLTIGSTLVLAGVLAACAGDNEATDNEVNETADTTTLTGTNAEETLTVEVTVNENNEIVDIVWEYDSESEIGLEGAGATVELILEAGNTDVDTVSGATSSSNAVLEAVNNALNN